MLRKIAIALVATGGVASIPVDAPAADHGGGGHGGVGFVRGGFGIASFASSRGVARSFASPGVVGAPHTFAGRGFVGPTFVVTASRA